MFEFLFKYPSSVFAKGKLVLLAGWPSWLLLLLALLVAVGLAWLMWKNQPGWSKLRSGLLWALQAAVVCTLLLMLWQPALSVSALKPQQNIVAIVVDNSSSMKRTDADGTRLDAAKKILDSGLLKDLEKRFQVRLYSIDQGLHRIAKTDALTGDSTVSKIGEGLKQLTAESSGLPVGAVLLLSDGADSAGGIDRQTIVDIRSQRIPVHTIGFGKEQLTKDLEIRNVDVPLRALADARLSAVVRLRNRGYGGQRTRLEIRDGVKILAAKDVTLAKDGKEQTESLLFNAGIAGARHLNVGLKLMDGEENQANNSMSRFVVVESRKPRVLYIEGEPRWEFKFIRRAVEEDRSLQLITMLRVTQNKILRQGGANAKELEAGFPTTAEELFQYDGLIIGSVDAGYFSLTQQELIRQFADRRGGGVLFLGGRSSLGDGGYDKTGMAEMLPVTLTGNKGTFERDLAIPSVTPAGKDSLILRLLEDPDKNVERWKTMPKLADFQATGKAKPGAVVLAEMSTPKGVFPLLTVQNYGRGRVAVFATSGSWRWQMTQPKEDTTHEMFWQQLLRWISSATQGQVVSSTPNPLLADDGKLPIRVDVREKNYLPVADADVTARILGPAGVAAQVKLTPDPVTPGVYVGLWNAPAVGDYVAEVEALRNGQKVGSDALLFRREDGVTENFYSEQNKELLEKLAEETGGKYWKPEDAKKLPTEISFSEAGITTRETYDLWNMPFFFLLLLAMRAGEWLLRRKWGAV